MHNTCLQKKCGLDIKPVRELITNHPSIISHHPLIVDAIFGTGLTKNITGIFSEVVGLINKTMAPVISVDIPSGISSDTGQVMGYAVKADYTVTFGLPKRGHILYPGAEYSGKLFIEDIGFPRELLQSEKIRVELIEKDDVKGLIPGRRKYSHKGDYGHVLVIAGSMGKTGAAFMTAKACLRSGAGLVTIGVPESLSGIFQSRVTEEMTLILPDKGDGTLSVKAITTILDFINEKADILAIGPGLGVSNDIAKIVKTLTEKSQKPFVLDADGLNSIKGDSEIFKKAKASLILTPHPGEMAGLLRRKAGDRWQKAGKENLRSLNSELRNKIEADRINTALSFSEETRTYLVLKGVPTIIATPDGRAYINSTGNPGMATAGTGDVLTGMISGFLSQNINPLDACILGVHMHGLAGDFAASEKGQHSMIASDIIKAIPSAFNSLKGDG